MTSSAFSVHHCRVLTFPQIVDDRGVLTPIENRSEIPFDIERVYYIYGLKNGATRAGHAHKKLQQVLIAVSGAFDVKLDDGREKRTIRLSQPHVGLHITPMIWREIDHFAPGSVCISLASARYDEADYYRGFEEFKIDALKADLR